MLKSKLGNSLLDQYLKDDEGLHIKFTFYNQNIINNDIYHVGQITCNNQIIYEGSLRNYDLDGRGTFYFADGSKYEGNFFHGYITGKGVIYEQTSLVKKGFFIKGKLLGEGVVYLPCQFKYKGQFKNGLYEGKGVMYYSDGSKYEGLWSAGKKHGKAIITNKDGNHHQAWFDNGWIKGQNKDKAEITTKYFIKMKYNLLKNQGYNFTAQENLNIEPNENTINNEQFFKPIIAEQKNDKILIPLHKKAQQIDLSVELNKALRDIYHNRVAPSGSFILHSQEDKQQYILTFNKNHNSLHDVKFATDLATILELKEESSFYDDINNKTIQYKSQLELDELNPNDESVLLEAKYNRDNNLEKIIINVTNNEQSFKLLAKLRDIELNGFTHYSLSEILAQEQQKLQNNKNR